LYQLLGILFAAFFFVAGVMLCIGAYRKWNWLVDPPDDMWLSYAQAFIKRIFGKKFTIFFTYFLGIVFMFVAISGLINSLRDG